MNLYPQVSLPEMAKICVAATTNKPLLRALIFSGITKTSLSDLGLLTTNNIELIRENSDDWESKNSPLYRMATLPTDSTANEMLEEAMSRRKRPNDPVFGDRCFLKRNYRAVLEQLGIAPHEWFLDKNPPWIRAKPPAQPDSLPQSLKWLSLDEALGELVRAPV